MPSPTPNEKAAATDNRDGLGFVLTTAPQPLWKKDRSDVFYHVFCALSKQH